MTVSLDDVVALVTMGREAVAGPFLVGIGGAVSVGKSTLAATLVDALAPCSVEVVATDGFLRTNDDLAQRGLLMQKGFPASYDEDLMLAFLADLRAGRNASLPEYSHATYDRIDGSERRVSASNDIVILEGVNALQPTTAPLLDLRIYLDADEPAIRGWYVERFLEHVDQAKTNETSFYRRFVDLPSDQQRQIAEGTWVGINLVNLVDHIAATRASADVVLTKAADHSLV